MADNTRVNDIQNKILQAMDIVNHSALNALSYDKTVLCTITDDTDKEEGKYIVSDGAKSFDAYSTDTKLKTKDNVYVMIPEGKYENQKMIVGKKTSKEEKPFIYSSPFDSYFPMTVNFAASAKPGELVANDDIEFVELLEAFDISEYNIVKYNRLGIRADLRSWIKNARTGTYGLAIALHTEKPSTTGDEMKSGTYTYFFDSSKMYGNPYSFETWYNQEIVLDLSRTDIGKVKTIDITFYQEKNFKNNQDQLIPHLEKNGTNKVAPNLFIQDIELTFGYDTSTFTDDFVEIYTADKYSYKRSTIVDVSNDAENAKKIGVRWIHMKDDQPFNMGISMNRKEVKYEIRWYRYRIGAAAADEFSSIYWERIEDASGFEYTFNPNVNQQQERIKAIVVVFDSNNNKIPYHSNELYFENEEDLPPSKEAQIIENALTITTDDETNGNYRIYRQDNTLKDSNESRKTRTLSLWFDINSDGEINTESERVTDYDHVTWIFPTRNTMLQLVNGGSYEKINLVEYESGVYYVWDAENEKYIISNDVFNNDQKYYIPKDKKETKFEEVQNLYRYNQYYLYKYIQCLVDTVDKPGTQFDNTKLYYQINENGEYEPVRNLTIDVFNYEKDNYYTLDYILSTEENGGFDENETYYLYNIESGELTNQAPQYKIASYYSPEKNNNTVICQYELNGVLYITEKEFTFGPAGTMGTNQTLVIDFLGDQKAITRTDTTAKFQVQIYNEQNKLQTIPDGAVKWSWYYNSDLPENTEIQAAGNAILELSYETGFKINSLYILQVEVGDLKTYFPIPIRENVIYSYIEGPSQVIYQSNGEPIYNKDNYKLFTAEDKEVSGLSWKILKDNFQCIGAIEETDFNKEIHFVKTGTSFVAATAWEKNVKYYVETKIEYVGGIKENTNQNGVSSYNLAPVSIYVENATIYGVQAYKTDNNNETAYWTQPILVMQNKWPNATVNAWDGKSLQIDKGTNSILAAAIAAGKKNNDNTFSGVMLGDWGKHDTETSMSKQTGVYGFHHGTMSYALTEDGNAFFGKEGRGRIYINGDNATLYSATWKSERTGMEIDLDRPYIKMSNGTNDIIIDASQITTPFKIGDKFSVKWDGTIKAEDGDFSGKIESESGEIGGWKITSTSLSKNRVSLDSTTGTISGATISGGTINGTQITTETLNISLPETESNPNVGKNIYRVRKRKSINDNWGFPEDVYTDGWYGDLRLLDSNGNRVYDYATAVEEWGYIGVATSQKYTPKAYLGMVQGNDGEKDTTGAGFKIIGISTPLIFEATGNARISTIQKFYLEANEIHFTCDAKNQHGIYARFAE